MAFYSKRSRGNLAVPGAPVERGPWVMWVIALAVLIGVATLAYHHIDLAAENDAARERVENPITSPDVPRSSTEHLPPSAK